MAEDYFGIVGTLQGSYRIEAVVAEGGFGVVYRAFHDAFQAPVAMKCLKIPVQLDSQHQQEFLEKFKEEAALMFKLSASIPAVVRPLHVDRIITSDGRFVPYLAMEWLDGEGVDALIARRASQGLPPLGIKKAVRLLAPVARALGRAHHFPTPEGPISIVHRDLKPDNIFIAKVNGEELVKIFDFGIAKVRSAATQVAGRLSQSGGLATAFTPGYGAPEQWLPKRFGQTGPWTDVFGLALTTLEVAAGKPIIDGDTAAMMGTACDEHRRPTPRNEGLEVSDQVEAVFLAALAVDPRSRFPDAGQFWDALESALGLELSVTPTMSGNLPRRDARSEGPMSVLPRDEQRRGASNMLDEKTLGEAPSGRIPELDLDLPPASRGSGKPMSSRPDSNRRNVQKEPVADIPALERSSTGSVSSGGPNIQIPLDIDANRRAAGLNAANPKPPPASIRHDAMASGGYPRVSASVDLPPTRVAQAAPLRQASPQGTLARLRTPLTIAGVGLFLSLLDQVILLAFENPFHLGPVRLTWVAGLLAAVGVVLVIKSLIFPEEER